MKARWAVIPFVVILALVSVSYQATAFHSFPAIETSSGGFQASSGGGIVVVTLPTGSGGIAAGDLLILILSCKASACGGENASWDLIDEESAGSSFTNARVFTRTADGTENTNSSFTTASNTQWAWQSYRIVGYDESVPVGSVSATSASSPSVSPDPPALNPVGWANESTLWLAVVTFACPSTFTEVTGSPTGYTTIREGNRCEENNWPADVGLSVEGTFRNRMIDSEDPSAFTLSQSQRWNVFTIAVRPQEDPVLVTLPADVIGTDRANLNGRLDTLFSSTVILSFEWGDTTALGNRSSNVTGSSTGEYTIVLNGLEANTTYFFRAFSEEVPSGYSSTGETLSFTTLEPQLDIGIMGLLGLAVFVVFVLGGSAILSAWALSRRRGGGA